jgi:uncharacterized DUF497 family protein
MDFEWDEDKNRENIAKHGLSFEVAQEAFGDKKRIIRKDIKHSQREIRMFCFGKIGDRVSTVRYTMRNGKIRIFGAGYWREGRYLYEKENV